MQHRATTLTRARVAISLMFLALFVLQSAPYTLVASAYQQVAREDDYVLYNFYDTSPNAVWRVDGVIKFSICPGGKLVAAWSYAGKEERVLQLLSLDDGSVVRNVTPNEIKDANNLYAFRVQSLEELWCLENGKILLLGSFWVNDTAYQALVLDIETLKATPYLASISVMDKVAGTVRDYKLVRLAYSPQSNLVAYILYYVNITPTIIAMDLHSTEVKWRLELSQLPYNWTTAAKGLWSPDGELLAVRLIDGQNENGSENIIVVNKRGELLWMYETPARKSNRGIMPFAWSPDSGLLFFMMLRDINSTITGFDALSGTRLWEWGVDDVIASMASYGNKLAAVSTWRNIYILNTKEGILIGAPSVLPEQARGRSVWANATLLLVKDNVGAGLVANKVPPIGLLSINYTDGPRGINVCVIPPEPITMYGYEVDKLCDSLGVVPWTMEVRLVEGTYTISVPAKDLLLLATFKGIEIPGLGKVELSDLARTYISTMGMIPIKNVTITDAELTSVSISLNDILEASLGVLDVKGPEGTALYIVPLGTTRDEILVGIPPTGQSLLLLPPGTYRVEYQVGIQGNRQFLAEVELQAGDHITLEIPSTIKTSAIATTTRSQTISETMTQPENQQTQTLPSTKTFTQTNQQSEEIKETIQQETTSTQITSTGPTLTESDKQEGGNTGIILASGLGVVVIALAVILFMRRH